MDCPPPPLFARGHIPGSTFNVFDDIASRTAGKDPRETNGGSDADNESNGVDSQEEAAPTVHRLRSEGSSPASTSARQRSPQVSRRSPMMRSVVIRGREPPASQILDFLYLGNGQDARNETFLRSHNITTILNVSHEEYWTPPGVTVHWLKADDTASFNIAEHFPRAVRLLDEVRQAHFPSSNANLRRTLSRTISSKENSTIVESTEAGAVPSELQLDRNSSSQRPCVLVHCQKGRSRSATIVMAYLIHANGWTVADALEYCARRRPSVEPNIGFMMALGDWQASMDCEGRTEKRSKLCISLRKVDANPAQVSSFFEQHVGLVMDVLSYQKPVAEANRAVCEVESEIRAQRQLADSSGGVSEPQRSSTSTCGASGSDVSPTRLVSAVPQSAENSCSNQSAVAEDAAVTECTPRKAERLLLVFFACRENVSNACELLKTQPELFRELGEPTKMECKPALQATKGAKRSRKEPMTSRPLVEK